MEVIEKLCSFRLVLEKKTGEEIPDFSRLEFLEKFLRNNSASSDAQDNNSGLLKRGGIADLPLLRTLLTIRQKSWQPSFWEVMNSGKWWSDTYDEGYIDQFQPQPTQKFY